MILACDVGGTKTDLALLAFDGSAALVVRRATYASREHAALAEIVADFVGPRPPALAAAGFGVSGPVSGGRARTTNLPWHVDAERLARAVDLPRVALLNDVVAQAWAVPLLGAGDQVTLQAGDARGSDVPWSDASQADASQADASRAYEPGTLAVIAAGTGLGYAALVRDGDATVALASEGGHADFSATDEDEVALQRTLASQHGRVSVERVVSGPGLYQGYLQLLARDGGDRANELDVHLAGHGASAPADPSAAVASAALEGRSALAERAVLRFLAAYGGEAGNWALRTLATGGVWLGGGVARKLLLGPPDTPETWRRRARGAFLERFRAKGRLSPLLATLPVHVITSDLAPLLGAAHCARTRHGR